MHVLIQPINIEDGEFYAKHGPHHKGDAGLDVYCIEDVTILPGETRAVDLGIRASAHRGRKDKENSIAYFLMPRSSISKTPLRLANSGEQETATFARAFV